MKNTFNGKIKKILLLMVIFILSLPNFAFAEDEVPISYDIYKSREGFWKNFIMDFGACRVTVRDDTGEIRYDYNVLPKQFENIDTMVKNLAESAVQKKDSEGREIFIMVKGKDPLHFKPLMEGGEYNAKDGIMYSDNIPQLTKIYDGSTKLPYVYLQKEFSEFTTMDTWEAYNNGENVNKLATDLGFDNGGKTTFYEWLKTTNGEGLSPSLEIQPLCLYLETTEQVLCNDFYTARDFEMQYNSDMGDYYKELEEMISEKDESWFGGIITGITHIFDTIATKLFAGKSILWFFSGRLLYYDCGVMVTETKTEKIEMNPSSNYDKYGSEAEVRKESNADKIVTINIEEPKMVNLTYTQTTKYSHPWSTKGFWFNYQKIDKGRYYTEDEMYDIYIADIKDNNTTEFEGKNFEDLGLTTREQWLDYLKNANLPYYVDFDKWLVLFGWEKKGDKYGRPNYKGIGDATHIYTDHNKYTTIINGTGKLIEKLLTIPNFECTSLPKYGAGLIPMTTNASQILIKFHSNLEQIGKGTGSTYIVIVLYVDWKFKGDGDNLSGAEGTGRTLTLFEDELSYVYDSCICIPCKVSFIRHLERNTNEKNMYICQVKCKKVLYFGERTKRFILCDAY